MEKLTVKNIDAIVTCDGEDRLLENTDLYCEDGILRRIGPGLPAKGKVIDGRGMLCFPGLVNGHHHLYQVFSRNLPQVQGLELFPWLTALYGVWKGLNEDTVRLSSLVGMGELMKNGCTTVFDHHYVFPKDAGDLIAAQAEAQAQQPQQSARFSSCIIGAQVYVRLYAFRRHRARAAR